MLSSFLPRLRLAAEDNPVAFFYMFRFVTWALAVIIYVTRTAPDDNLLLGLGLSLYSLAHLSIGITYALTIYPRLRTREDTLLKPLRSILVVSALDTASSLAVVYFSGGWGSPFWHFAVTSILAPCFLVTFRVAIAITTAFVGLYTLTIAYGGSGLQGEWTGTQLHLFIGFIFTAYLVGMAVSYLGHIFRSLEVERLRTRSALRELEILFDVARNVMEASPDEELLLEKVINAIDERHQYNYVAVYLWDDEADTLTLASATFGMNGNDSPPEHVPDERFVGKAASSVKTQTEHKDGMLSVAVPMESDDGLLGVLLTVVTSRTERASNTLALPEALANQIAIGIQNARLQQQKIELAAEEERSRIAREIHDGVAQSMYALNLNLETCAELAERDKGPLRERLQKLVPLAKQTLLETRYYIYDLKPLLSGESNLGNVAENQAKEFQMVSGIPTELHVEGTPISIPIATATGFYRILQEIFANVLKHSSATKVEARLSFEGDSINMLVEDDGVGFDVDQGASGHGLGNLEHRAKELGGTFHVKSALGKGTKIEVSLPVLEVAIDPN